MIEKPIATKPLANGTPLPDFMLQGEEGQVYTPAVIQKSKGVPVAFIHGTWCPSCLNLLLHLNLIAPELESMKVGLICIASNSAEELKSYREVLDVPLRSPLLSDSSPSISHSFGVYDPDHESPYPSVFYAGAAGKILYSDVSPDPDCFPNLELLIGMIQQGIDGKGSG